MLVAVANAKGGAGKTTISVNLAGMLSREGATLLVDTDPHKSASSWYEWRCDTKYKSDALSCEQLHGLDVYERIGKLAKKYTHIVVDVGANDSASMRAAMLAVDELIVPVGMSGFDGVVLDDTIDVINLVRSKNPSLRVRAVLNRIDKRASDIQQMLRHIKSVGLAPMTALLSDRATYRRAATDGLLPDEYEPGGNAAHEFKLFFKEVMQ